MQKQSQGWRSREPGTDLDTGDKTSLAHSRLALAESQEGMDSTRDPRG